MHYDSFAIALKMSIQNFVKMDENDIELFDLLNDLNNFNDQANLFYRDCLNRQFRKYNVRKRFDPFVEYTNIEFKRRFRFCKNQVRYIYDLIDGADTLEPMVIFFLFTTNYNFDLLLRQSHTFEYLFTCRRLNVRISQLVE